MTRFLTVFLLCAFVLPAHEALQAQNLNMTFRSKTTFPGQILANICGYAAAGREYALVGAKRGMVIVDVTNPDAPVKIVQIPGPDNWWKEIKTYKHYAYVTTEGGEGVQIVDLSKLPSPDLAYKHYKGDGEIAGDLNTIHALHIDTTAGFLYAHGSNLFGGGPVILDLSDPFNPTYAGKFDELGYVHDGWVDNDTLYAGHIGAGFFSIVDMRDKSKPVVLGAQRTPNSATHNTWMSKDRSTIFTTDEVAHSFLAAYDIRDPEDIQLLDKIQAVPGSAAIVHNTHIVDNYAVTSWYSEGVSIVDVSRPSNLVQVGLYDVAPGYTGGEFVGCWGVYPYLPSGNIIASVIGGAGNESNTGELWVLTPNYKKACYLEGIVTDAVSGNPIAGAQVKILNGNAGAAELTVTDGSFKTGQATAGVFQIEVSRAGYVTQSIPVTLSNGEVTVLNVALSQQPTVAVSGMVVVNGSNEAIPNAKVVLLSNGLNYETTTGSDGSFLLPAVSLGKYELRAGAWGYSAVNRTNQNIAATQAFTLKLDKGYRDDFGLDYGWEVSGTSTTGVWERADPITISPGGGFILTPENDAASDIGTECYVTGNDGQLDVEDVEDGTMNLISPVMDLSTYNDPGFRGLLYFTSITFTQNSFDSLKIYISNGTEEALLFESAGFTFSWQLINKKIKPLLPLTKTMRVRIECFDNPAITEQDSYEAAFDGFRIVEGSAVGAQTPELEARFTVRANPFADQTLVEYETPAAGNYQLKVYDLLGRCQESFAVDGTGGFVFVGATLPAGMYIARLEQNGLVSREVKLAKTNTP